MNKQQQLPVDVLSLVSISGIKSSSCLLSLAYASWLKPWPLGRVVCIYTYPGGKVLICELRAASGDRVAQVVFRAKVVLVLRSAVWGSLVQVHASHCASSVSLDSLPSSFINKDSHPIGFHKQWPADVLLQASHSYAPDSQLSPSSHQELRHKDAWSGITISMLRHAQTHLWPSWHNSRQRICWTVLAVPDLLALPQ